MSQEHTADVRNIQEGDTVTLETDEALVVEAECKKVRHESAADPSIVRETKQWYFESNGKEVMIQIVDGLRHREGTDSFPHHYQMCVPEQGGDTFGYVEDAQIHGKAEA